MDDTKIKLNICSPVSPAVAPVSKGKRSQKITAAIAKALPTSTLTQQQLQQIMTLQPLSQANRCVNLLQSDGGLFAFLQSKGIISSSETILNPEEENVIRTLFTKWALSSELSLIDLIGLELVELGVKCSSDPTNKNSLMKALLHFYAYLLRTNNFLEVEGENLKLEEIPHMENCCYYLDGGALARVIDGWRSRLPIPSTNNSMTKREQLTIKSRQQNLEAFDTFWTVVRKLFVSPYIIEIMKHSVAVINTAALSLDREDLNREKHFQKYMQYVHDLFQASAATNSFCNIQPIYKIIQDILQVAQRGRGWRDTHSKLLSHIFSMNEIYLHMLVDVKRALNSELNYEQWKHEKAIRNNNVKTPAEFAEMFISGCLVAKVGVALVRDLHILVSDMARAIDSIGCEPIIRRSMLSISLLKNERLAQKKDKAPVTLKDWIQNIIRNIPAYTAMFNAINIWVSSNRKMQLYFAYEDIIVSSMEDLDNFLIAPQDPSGPSFCLNTFDFSIMFYHLCQDNSFDQLSQLLNQSIETTVATIQGALEELVKQKRFHPSSDEEVRRIIFESLLPFFATWRLVIDLNYLFRNSAMVDWAQTPTMQQLSAVIGFSWSVYSADQIKTIALPASPLEEVSSNSIPQDQEVATISVPKQVEKESDHSISKGKSKARNKAMPSSSKDMAESSSAFQNLFISAPSSAHNVRKVIAWLQEIGLVPLRHAGGHTQFGTSEGQFVTTVPNSSRDRLKPKTANSIVKAALESVSNTSGKVQKQGEEHKQKGKKQ